MLFLARLGLLDLLQAWKINLLLVGLCAAISLAFITLSAYRAGMQAAFPPIDSASLLVQQAQTMGEINGSRIPGSIGDTLAALGMDPVIPEIHAIAGTSAADIAMLRGVDPARYRGVLQFSLRSGAALEASSTSRQAMLGWRLAERRGAQPGGTIRLRGRTFEVLGIFETGTYADNEAWVTLDGARSLLGWGDDVSIFIVPGNGILQPGAPLPAALPPGLAVIRRGEGVQVDIRHNFAIFNLIEDIARLAGVTTAALLATVLLRLAWLRRRNLGILRCVGFTRRGLAAYLLAQSAAVSVLGTGAGLLASLLLTTRLFPTVFGLEVHPVYDARTLWMGAAWTAAIALAGMLAPAAWFSRAALSGLLYRES